MAVIVLPDIDAISHEAARIFIHLSKECIASRGRFIAALSGGSTPQKLYALLASDRYRGNVEWSKIHFFWVDERCVPKESEYSNFRLAFDNLLSRISIPDENKAPSPFPLPSGERRGEGKFYNFLYKNIHRIKGEYGPEKAAQDYENELKNFFGVGLPIFDLILLGMGEDGHTASLFPGSKSLDEKKRLVIPVYAEKMNRITLTLPVLNSARHILFLVSGQSKTQVLNDILADNKKRKNYPAGLIYPVHGDLLWLTDEATAGKVKKQNQNKCFK